jgi:serine/threonine-protein kinase
VLDQLLPGLSERYRVERELGAGGMATVYLAHDVRHDRHVALKLLKPDLGDALGAERFLTEIKLCARLQHPHILTVLDSGETAGRLWFTMPYVEGESLRDRLNREKQLPLEDALQVSREAALALDYAHRHGVVHRDVKPENILLSDGHALVADFGIGRALAPGQQRLTMTGLAVGTPAYMSPEQAAGDPETGPRSDIYSLATVLYEMLTGETPFSAPTPQATIARLFTETARPVRKIRESVPEHVELALERALSRTAADRFATAAEFAHALAPSPATQAISGSHTARSPRAFRRPSPALATLGLGFLLGLGVLFAWRRGESSDRSDGAKPIAVLPFENVGDAADEYFADGIADEVRGKLSALPGLRVTASRSAREYKKTTKSLDQIGRELGVEYLLVGKVRWAKAADGTSRVLVSPELVHLAGGTATTRWEQPFDASLTDVFKVQADIATQVASALDVALADKARRAVAAAPTASLSAYDAFLKGEAASQEMSVSDAPSLRRAIPFYEQAVAFDSTFVRAWGRLARAKSMLYTNSQPTPERANAARDAAERAERLAPGQPEGAAARAAYYTYVAIDNAQALAALEQALKLAPNDVELLTIAAVVEQSSGKPQEALGHYARARALDPRSASTGRRMGTHLTFLRRYAEARALLDSVLALAPTNLFAIESRAMVELALGNLAGARAVVRAASPAVDRAELIASFGVVQDLYWVLDDEQQRQLLELPPRMFDDNRAAWALVLMQTYHLRGDRVRARVYADSAQLALAEQLKAAPGDGQLHVMRGLALAYAGVKAEAIAEGERGTALWPMSRDSYMAPYLQHQLARIYALVGEPDKAIDLLESLLRVPYYLSPGWLRIDPEFTMLEGNPRFERLIAPR